MFANRTSRKQALAGQAWNNLVTTVESAGHSTRHAGRRAAGFVDTASGRVGSGAKEARERANRAFDALAGKRAPAPWGLLALVAAVGAAAGWVVAVFGRRLAPAAHDELADLVNETPVDLTGLRR